MIVGIIDCDIFIEQKNFKPNIQVMLLSAYHKQRGDIVRLLLNGKDLQLCNKIYVIRDSLHKYTLPQELYSLPNVEVGGRYFSNGVISPVIPDLFQYTPDKSIYDNYVRYWKSGPIKGLKKLETTQYISIQKEPMTPSFLTTVVYDPHLGSRADYEILKSYKAKRLFKKIRFAYPVICHTLEDVLLWAQTDWITKGGIEIVYDKVITAKELNKLKDTPLRHKIQAYFVNQDRFYNDAERDIILLEGINLTFYNVVNRIPVILMVGPKVKKTTNNFLFFVVQRWNIVPQKMSFVNFAHRTNEQILVEEVRKRNPKKDYLFTSNPIIIREQGGTWLYDR